MRRDSDHQSALVEWLLAMRKVPGVARTGRFLLGTFVFWIVVSVLPFTIFAWQLGRWTFAAFIWCFIFLVFGYMVYEARLARKIKTSKALVELPAGLERLAVFIRSLAFQMDIRESMTIRIDTADFGRVPRVSQSRDVVFLILPLGFLKIFPGNLGQAQAVLAHELAHVRQKDTRLLIVTRSFTKIATVIFFALIVFFTCDFYKLSIEKWEELNFMELHIHSRMMSRISGSGEPLTPEQIGQLRKAQDQILFQKKVIPFQLGAWSLIFLVYFGFFYFARSIRYRSEYNADLGAAIFTSSASIQAALDAVVENPVTGWRRLAALFSVYPSLARRRAGLNRIARNYPSLSYPPLKSQGLVWRSGSEQVSKFLGW